MGITRNAFLAALAAFSPILAVAQSAPAHPEFEVASIRAAGPIEGKASLGMHIDGAQVRFASLSIRDCMRLAWQVKQYQVVGPEWIGSDRYDITAKIPEGASQEQIRQMLQNLLADRFKLTLHHEKRDFAVYALEIGKGGLKLKESAASAQASAGEVAKPGLNVNASGSEKGVYIDLGQGAFITFADNHLVGQRVTMTQLTDQLSNYLDKPAVEMTGLPATATYDFSFAITPEDYRTMLIRIALKSGVTLPPGAERLADLPTDSLFAALEASGLKLESKKAPLDVMVIDNVNKTPTEN